MAGEVKLTKAQRRALEWLAARGPVSAFGRDDPSLTTIKRLRDIGLVETRGRDPGMYGFTRFAVSPAGRAALHQDKADDR